MTPIPMHKSYSHVQPSHSAEAYPARLVTAILVISVIYLSILSFLNAKGFAVSAALVGGTEVLIYGGCLYLVRRSMPLTMIAFSFCVFSWLIFTWLIRQAPDLKGIRDLIIPILFLSLGRYVADRNFADRSLKLIVYILVAVGLFEAFFEEAYAELFNTFSFYNNIGGISESSAMFSGQMLTLNGYRPEGIGRTIFPVLLGPHRVSSLLMEPVAVGNFSVILMAWALSKPWSENKKNPVFMIGAVILIILSDSRFGMMMAGLLLCMRLFPLAIIRRIAPIIPFFILGLVLFVASTIQSHEDNFIGRVGTSGREILNFNWRLLLGFDGQMSSYGDMGYAYVISRFSAPLAACLISALFLTTMKDERGVWFRSLIVLYFFSNLAISGTSVFALKTGGLLWFLFGVLADYSSPAKKSPQKFFVFNTELAAAEKNQISIR